MANGYQFGNQLSPRIIQVSFSIQYATTHIQKHVPALTIASNETASFMQGVKSFRTWRNTFRSMFIEYDLRRKVSLRRRVPKYLNWYLSVCRYWSHHEVSVILNRELPLMEKTRKTREMKIKSIYEQNFGLMICRFALILYCKQNGPGTTLQCKVSLPILITEAMILI